MLRRLEGLDMPKNLGKFNLLEMLSGSEEVSFGQLECLKTVGEPLENQVEQ
ncbi:conserved hypothetical protein [Ricinus communis]|uniref:Uncharacterized protein n=1 Tax=Ricinus communis TaxID=3988 RepID=B9SPZ4_RICCO|nr:conserved hypothetical protein [Ricinus communis]